MYSLRRHYPSAGNAFHRQFAGMPPASGNKRVKGVSIYRPFVFGNVARPIDPEKRPEGVPPDHSHQWTVWVKGVNDEDISYWLKKVQFKLHDTYPNSLRTIEHPPFEVTETGWGEFELTIKLFFVPESGEKPQTLWHSLKIHPYGPDADVQRAERRPIISQNYEEIIFNEPFEQFYEILTSGGGSGPASERLLHASSAAMMAATAGGGGGGVGGGGGRGQGGKPAGGKTAAAAAAAAAAGVPLRPGAMLAGGRVDPSSAVSPRSAEVPLRSAPGNPYSRETEGKELDRMKEAIKKVEELIAEERAKLDKRELKLQELRKTEGFGMPPKKK